MRTCAECKAAGQVEKFCTNCGAPIPSPDAAPDPLRTTPIAAFGHSGDNARGDPTPAAEHTVSLVKPPTPGRSGQPRAVRLEQPTVSLVKQRDVGAIVAGEPPPPPPPRSPSYASDDPFAPMTVSGDPQPIAVPGAPTPLDRACAQVEQPASYPPAGAYPPARYPILAAPGQEPAAASKRGSAQRGWLIAALAFVVVAVLATATLLVLQRGGDSAGGGVVTATGGAPRTAQPPVTARPPVTAKPPATAAATAKGRDAVTSTQTVVVTMTGRPRNSPAVTTAIGASAAMGGPRADISCGSGYIVQVASELDRATFEQRVAELRAAGTLPPGARWTDTSSSCAIFSSQTNVLVLYAGPFPSVADACPARLASPPDAIIKATTSGTAAPIGCLCPTPTERLPAISTVGQQSVWVGELQRALGGELDYSVGDINADRVTGNPGHWGSYTAGTAAAVERFQGANSLPVNGKVGIQTWSAIKNLTCADE